MDDAVRLANRAGESLVPWISGLPLRFCRHYPAPQIPPRHQRGGYEGVASRLDDPLVEAGLRAEDTDPHRGVIAVGARPFLVAFNAYLDTDDVEVARTVARQIRERRRPSCRKGARLRCGRQAQVSMNLTDLEQTTIPVALEAVRSAAADLGASVDPHELAGLAPLEVLQTARYYLGLRELDAHHVLESNLWPL